MKYLIRSIKYFFYFAVLFCAIVLALVLIGAVEGDINAIFEDGYGSLWKIAVFFALIAAVYPKVGFITNHIKTELEWSAAKEKVIAFMIERNYIIESEDDNLLTFRYRDVAGKITRMAEDRITVSSATDGLTMEGLRKDVMRLSTGLEHLGSLR